MMPNVTLKSNVTNYLLFLLKGSRIFYYDILAKNIHRCVHATRELVWSEKKMQMHSLRFFAKP